MAPIFTPASVVAVFADPRSEAELQRLILGQLHQLDRDHGGCWCGAEDCATCNGSPAPVRLYAWRANVGAAFYAADTGPRMVRYGKRGQCDISGLFLPGGRRLEIEVKFGRGKRSPDQVRFGALMQRLGALYVVAWTLEQAIGPVRKALETEI